VLNKAMLKKLAWRMMSENFMIKPIYVLSILPRIMDCVLGIFLPLFGQSLKSLYAPLLLKSGWLVAAPNLFLEG